MLVLWKAIVMLCCFGWWRSSKRQPLECWPETRDSPTHLSPHWQYFHLVIFISNCEQIFKILITTKIIVITIILINMIIYTMIKHDHHDHLQHLHHDHQDWHRHLVTRCEGFHPFEVKGGKVGGILYKIIFFVITIASLSSLSSWAYHHPKSKEILNKGGCSASWSSC